MYLTKYQNTRIDLQDKQFSLRSRHIDFASRSIFSWHLRYFPSNLIVCSTGLQYCQDQCSRYIHISGFRKRDLILTPSDFFLCWMDKLEKWQVTKWVVRTEFWSALNEGWRWRTAIFHLVCLSVCLFHYNSRTGCPIFVKFDKHVQQFNTILKKVCSWLDWLVIASSGAPRGHFSGLPDVFVFWTTNFRYKFIFHTSTRLSTESSLILSCLPWRCLWTIW